jgi:hypothetical protein
MRALLPAMVGCLIIAIIGFVAAARERRAHRSGKQ